METPIGGKSEINFNYKESDLSLFRQALDWTLRYVVTIHALHGMNDLRLRWMNRIIVKISAIVSIVVSWYLVLKCLLVATTLYSYSSVSELLKLDSPLQYNCSVAKLMQMYASSNLSHSHSQEASALIILTAQLADSLGGPFKLMGNRATLIYSWFAIGLYAMLAIFPTELLFLHVPFNIIQFALNDKSSLDNCMAKKHRHLLNICNWSRNDCSSILTLGMKRAFNRRQLRCIQADGSGDEIPTKKTNKAPTKEANPNVSDGHLKLRGISRWRSNIEQNLTNFISLMSQPDTPVKSLRQVLSVNHRDRISYDVCVARLNVEQFLPYARSIKWYKNLVIFYTVLIVYFFSIILGANSLAIVYFQITLNRIYAGCQANSPGESIEDLAALSLYDRILWVESLYAAYLIALGASFYCAYYFSTIFELLIWIGEVEQQLDLCRLVMELDDHICLHASKLRPQGDARFHYRFDERRITILHPIPLTSPDGLKTGFEYFADLKVAQLADELMQSYGLRPRDLRDHENIFGAFDSFRSIFEDSSQSKRFRIRSIMSVRLLTKRQTLFLSTYLNFNMLLDEFKETRFMMKLILRRTTEYAFGFAVSIALTRSQFKSHYFQVTVLLGVCLGILNMYLAGAAIVNTRVSYNNSTDTLIAPVLRDPY